MNPLESITLPFVGDKLFSLVSGNILMISLVLFFICYSVVSVFLIYHWTAYGMRHAGVILAETVFILVSVLLFIVAIISINYF